MSIRQKMFLLGVCGIVSIGVYTPVFAKDRDLPGITLITRAQR